MLGALTVLLVIAANSGAWLGIVSWRADVDKGRTQADNLGTQIADVRAEQRSLSDAKALLTTQLGEGTTRISEIGTESQPILDHAAEVRGLAARMDTCVTDRAALIAALWVSSAASQAAREAAAKADCDAALADLDRLFPGGKYP